MQYPPLSNGSFRYGDPPRPLPSPVPGPDPQPVPPWAAAYQRRPGYPPQAGAHYPAGPPAATGVSAGAASSMTSMPGAPPDGAGYGHGEPEERRGPSRRTLLALGGAGVAAVLALALTYWIGSALSPEPETIHSIGTLELTSGLTWGDVSGTPEMCVTPPSLADIGEGTPIMLESIDGEQLASSTLTYTGGGFGWCDFGFTFDGIPVGEGVYILVLPGRGDLQYSELELRQGPTITLGG